MKGYLIPFGGRSIIGVNKKINLQINELSKISDLTEADVEIDLSDRWIILKSIFTRGSLPVDYFPVLERLEDPDYLFIRHAGVDRQFIRFLRSVKERYPKCRIVIEFPTYPYLRERLRERVNWLLLLGELYHQRKLKKYTDRIVAYTEFATIFGIEVINIFNGIDVDSIKPIETELTDKIVLLSVAHMQPYHGFERLIRGLKEYYGRGGERKIELYLVGEGNECKKYKELVEKVKIGDHVRFFGKQTGEQLEKIYQQGSVGVTSFGDYKIGVDYSSTLKSREYLAHGLPVIGATKLDVFVHHPAPYYLKFPNDASTVDVDKIVEFYDQIYQENNRSKVSKEIHRYAREHVDISKTMKPVLDYLEHITEEKS